MAETGSDTRSGIGARLRAGRERMGLTLLQVAEKLHVDAKVVESLESERFDALGAPVFVRGHLKHYAELIGEQAAQLLELYTGSNKPVQPDLTRVPKAAPASKPSQLAVPALLVLIVFVLISVVWWVLQSVRTASTSNPAPAAREVPLEPELSTPAGDLESAGAEPPSGTPSASATAASRAGGPQVAASARPSGTSTAANVGTTAPVAPSAQSASPAAPAGAVIPARGKPMEVTLHFAADSWVEVYDANGERLFYDIGSADSQRTLSGTPPLRVTFGNAPGVTLVVNGKPATVPANAMRDDTAQFVINRSGRIVRARQQPEGN